MAAIESPETVGIEPIGDFEGAAATWPRGDRPAAIREAAAEFRARWARPDNRVRAVRTVDIASAGYPASFAFGGAARGANPYINIINRLQVIQFDDHEGRLRTLAYEPTVTEGPAEAPFYEQMIARYGEFVSYKVLAKIFNTVEEALRKTGLEPADVDFVSFDHLHVQDVRFVLGSTEAGRDGKGPIPALFPNAKLITQRREWDTFKSLHPMQWAWYVEQATRYGWSRSVLTHHIGTDRFQRVGQAPDNYTATVPVGEQSRRPEHGDGATIGILLACYRDDDVVEYALRTVDAPLTVATYTTDRNLPADLRAALPSSADLADLVTDVTDVTDPE